MWCENDVPMKFPHAIPITEIAAEYNAEIIGDKTIEVTGINEIHKVEKGDLMFSDLEKYHKKALDSNASVIILNKPAECPEGKAIIVYDEPFEIYDALVAKYRPFRPIHTMIDESADIHPTAIIEPNVVIGPDVTIGAETHVQSGAVIREFSIIGKRVIIQSGAMIGTDAFYFKKETGVHTRWHSGGRVVIEDDVYIGANSTINKGVSGDTVVGEGTKVDCLVHVGHGAVIGKHCIVAGQVGIAGKSIIGDRCFILGQTGIAASLKIGDDVVLHPQTGVGKDLEGGKRYFGTPAKEWTTAWRELAALRKLPDLIHKIEEKVNEKSDS